MTQAKDWLRFLPVDYHPQARALVDWLDTRPLEEPDACPRCQSRDFKTRVKNGRYDYMCRRCRKSFCRSTGTPFHHTQYPERWGEFARYRLAGMSLVGISERMLITIAAARFRDNVMLSIILERYPALHEWWNTHQSRENPERTEKVNRQLQVMLDWVAQRMSQQESDCPRCGYHIKKLARYQHRPQFVCNHCKYTFNLLKNTPLKGMLYPEKWADALNALVNGENIWSMQARFEISTHTLYRWRDCFIALMEELELDELLAWMRWQRNRGFEETRLRRKSGETFTRPGLSRFNGRGTPKETGKHTKEGD